MWRDNKGRELKTTQTSLQILELIIEQEGLALADLDRMIDKPKSTLHSHLHTLLDNRYLVRDGDVYTASFRVSLLGDVIRNRYPHYETIQEAVEDLAERTGEEANFTILEHGRLLFAHGASGDSATEERDTDVRSEYYLHNTAAGKAILASMDRNRAKRILNRWEAPYKSEVAATNQDHLLNSLDEIADRGYGIFNEESAPGLIAVGAPIHSDEEIIGGLSVGGPKYRIDLDRLHNELADTLLERVATLERTIQS